MSNPDYEYRKRQELQADRQAYRDAAKRLHPDVKVADHCHVAVAEDGAFVECTVWVPKEKLTDHTPSPRQRAIDALTSIIEIGKRDMSNEKYDGYFEEAKAVLEDLCKPSDS